MHNIQGVELREGLQVNLVKVSDLIYFEGPLLSRWRDREGKDYLYYWCDVDENYNRWLILPVPSEMLKRYLQGEEILRTLVTHPEIAYLVEIDSNGDEQKVKQIVVSDLPEDYLPSEDSYYDPELAMSEETEDTEADLNFLPSNTLLGKLRIVEVLDGTDKPRFFIAENASGNHYIAFQAQAEHLESESLWFYASVSESRIDEVMRGKVILRKIYTEPEDEIIFRVRIAEGGKAILDPLKPDQIEPNLLLPLEDFSLPEEPFFAEEALVADNSQPTIHEIIVDRPKAKTATPFQSLASVAANWSQLIHAYLGVPPVSVGIKLGSLKVTLQTEAGDQLPNFFKVLGNLIKSPTAQKISETLNHEERKRLELLLTSLQKDKLTLFSKIAFDEIHHSLKLSYAETKELKSILLDLNSKNVDSIDVPQADDLDKVLRMVELIREGETKLGYHLSLSPRQVRYYKQAAQILDLLNEAGSITRRGLFLLNLSASERYKIALFLFESSSVGFAWLCFCEVSSALELNPESAEDFLHSQCSNLSITTLRRRAKTLKRWVASFQMQLQE